MVKIFKQVFGLAYRHQSTPPLLLLPAGWRRPRVRGTIQTTVRCKETA